jgi:hypothetical protein
MEGHAPGLPVDQWSASFGQSILLGHMKSPRTKSLLMVGICLLLIAPLLLRGVVAHRPVLTPTGEQVFRADGKPLYRHDAFGQFKVNWDAYTLGALGLLCLGWSGVRGLRYLYEHWKQEA